MRRHMELPALSYATSYQPHVISNPEALWAPSTDSLTIQMSAVDYSTFTKGLH